MSSWPVTRIGSAREKRLFGTVTQQLKELARWLQGHHVTAVAMEATGIYWVPVWNVLEPEGFDLVLINPEHYPAVRGKKTDLKDGERIAELLQDGRLQGSYVPPVEARILRDLTRYRTKLVQHQSALSNRIQKLLEQGDVKLAQNDGARPTLVIWRVGVEKGTKAVISPNFSARGERKLNNLQGEF